MTVSAVIASPAVAQVNKAHQRIRSLMMDLVLADCKTSEESMRVYYAAWRALFETLTFSIEGNYDGEAEKLLSAIADQVNLYLHDSEHPDSEGWLFMSQPHQQQCEAGHHYAATTAELMSGNYQCPGCAANRGEVAA